MKSLNRWTPLVLINKSKGGLSWVYKFLVIVDDVIVSGSAYTVLSRASEVSLCVDSGCSVVDEHTESSVSEIDGECAGDGSRKRESEALRFWERIFWVILVWENGRALGKSGLEYSSTVERIAVVISSREVYGKHTFRIWLEIRELKRSVAHRGKLLTFYSRLSIWQLCQWPPAHLVWSDLSVLICVCSLRICPSGLHVVPIEKASPWPFPWAHRLRISIAWNSRC